MESEGIIERIDVYPDDFNKYIWVPHSPVIKKDPVCTIKIRSVFNYSLRMESRPSLNDYLYPRINLFTDMRDLLLTFRCNHFVLVADIRKPFLIVCVCLYIYIYIYIYMRESHPQIDCFVVSQLFSVAGHARWFQLEFKPVWFYVTTVS